MKAIAWLLMIIGAVTGAVYIGPLWTIAALLALILVVLLFSEGTL